MSDDEPARCGAISLDGAHICDRPHHHEGDHEGPELPTVELDEPIEQTYGYETGRAKGRAEVIDALTEKWRALPVWGPDERGLHILDGVDHEGLMRDLAALRLAGEPA